MTKKQTPLIVKSELTKPPRWYVLTRYKEKRGINPATGDDVAYISASEKFDVTDDIGGLIEKHGVSFSVKQPATTDPT